MRRLSDVPAFSVKYLDSIVNAGAVLNGAVNELPREYLCALADRVGIEDRSGWREDELRKVVKRRLVGAGGRIREPR